jgi:laminin alpha 3/5
MTHACQLVFTEDVFNVGNDITLSLEVRPRSLTGVLLSVHADNDGDFLLLQMVNGEQIMSMELNGVNNCFESYSLTMKLLNTWCWV